jgi:hypothetical protein
VYGPGEVGFGSCSECNHVLVRGECPNCGLSYAHWAAPPKPKPPPPPAPVIAKRPRFFRRWA